jgi:type IV pilus assembly protein PilY1
MKTITKQVVLAGAIALSFAGQPAQAALLNLATQPLYLGTAIPPSVMLTMTKDQQLYKKAYNDFADLDSDGVLETTYKHSITYYGYFDSFKCYDYVTANLRFEPFAANTDKYCTGASAGKWSGNFLNWVSMTRMDAVRKLLYGGLRSTDTATLTVLERMYLPTDAHSYAKYYNGTDTNQLTPFAPANTAPTSTSTTSITVGNGVDRTWAIGGGNALTTYSLGDQLIISRTSDPTVTMTGVVACVNNGGTQTAALGKSCNTSNTILVNIPAGASTGSGTNITDWTITNKTRVGITFCNTTLGGTGTNGTGSIGSPQNKSQTNTNPPLMRVALGDYSLWTAQERWQCYFREESTAPGQDLSDYGRTRNNGNRAFFSGLYANTFEPRKAAAAGADEERGIGSDDYVVRVKACVAGLLGTEKCKEYNTSNQFKPIGLLQVYGDPGLINFGLLTGSYSKNISGGVLRKNTGSFTDEVAADGTFLTPAGGGIVNTLNRMRIYGYYYGDGTYLGSNGDNCGFQLTSITEGNCRSWGNPMSEIYFESLRYFAGATSPTAAFSTTNDSSLISGLGTATWPATATTVVSNSNYCIPLNILVFNSSVSTNEADNQIGSLSVINSSQTANQLTTTVGNNEPGSGAVTNPNSFFFGKTATLASSNSGFELCTAKTLATGTGLGDVIGICPEGPTLEGSYLISGLAYHAKVNRIRTDLTAVPTADAKSLKVTTYGINLSTNVPTLPLKVTGDTVPRIILQPAYRLNNSAPQGGGSLVDLKIVSQVVTATSNKGELYLNWEDSEQGGDYDQDMWGTLTWCMQLGSDTTSCPQNIVGTAVTANTISITTRSIAQSTAQPQGFGYIITGTLQDGPHFHSGILNFNFTDPANVTVTPNAQANASGGCNSCGLLDPATTVVYSVPTSATTGQALKDPLYYAAKYGAFKDSDGNNLPNLTSEWDTLLANGAPGSDGSPDTYFLVSNPLGLETALNKAFLTILQVSSASSVATNSTSLNTGSKVFQARFNSNDWSGQLRALPVNADGSTGTTADWDAADFMNPVLTAGFSPSTRKLITFNKGLSGAAPRGIPLQWPSSPASPTTGELTPAQITALKTNPGSGTVESDTIGASRLAYLRGDSTNEGLAPGDFRRRQGTKLGDIVNSNPVFVGVPSSGFGDAAYASFRTTYINRTPVIYAASNDGLLHGFDASTGSTKGTEVLGYMSSKALLKANKLTNQSYNASHEYFFDGSPEVQDVCTAFNGSNICTAWSTMLAVTMGAGGQSVSLLDVTDPSSFSEANASSIVKWEFTDADDPDLGFTYGQSNPLLRKMANGKFAVIVSGGYNNSAADGNASTTGVGVIFILFVSGPTGTNGAWQAGTDYIKITTPQTIGPVTIGSQAIALTTIASAATPNGLAQPFAVDFDSDGKVDFLYAGDLRGNFWKFDVRTATTSNWTAATSQVILFRATDSSGNTQPVTAPAEGSGHVTGTGFLINFGTGKYLEPSDVTPGTTPYLTQSYYGIWDKNDGATVSLQTTVSRNQLYEQQVLGESTVGGKLARAISGDQKMDCTTGTLIPGHVVSSPNAAASGDTLVSLPNWTSTACLLQAPLNRGWLLDWASASPNVTLTDKTPITGERAVFPPQLLNGRLTFTTLIPNVSACLFGGDSPVMVIDNMTGGRFSSSPFDTNGDGQFNTSDFVNIPGVGLVPISGMSSGIGITGSPTMMKFGGGGGAGGITSGSGGSGTGTGGAGNYLGGYVGGSGSAAAVFNTWLGILSGSSGATTSVLLDMGANSIGRLNWREVTND